jgi:hypothetical protein
MPRDIVDCAKLVRKLRQFRPLQRFSTTGSMAIGRNAIIACNRVREAVTRRACTNWFRTVPASVRAKIFIGVARSWRDADGLALVSDPHLRLLAFLALLVQSRDQKSWDDARRSRLLGHRNDPASTVAICAQVFFIADEE